MTRAQRIRVVRARRAIHEAGEFQGVPSRELDIDKATGAPVFADLHRPRSFAKLAVRR